MSVYTVHAPASDSAAPLSQADRYVFIRDGFHFWAVIFGPFWLLVHRLWLAFIGYVVVVGALEVAMWALSVGSVARLLVMVLIAVLMGNEAANIRRWSFSRRRWREIGLVAADNLESAERRFFDKAERSSPPVFHPSDLPPSSAGPLSSTRPASDVIGLFPQPGAIR